VPEPLVDQDELRCLDLGYHRIPTSKDVRLRHRRTEARFQEVAVAALVRLADVAREHPAVAAAEARLGRHRSPRAFGQVKSTWTLTLLAPVAYGQGLSATVLSAETIRQALARLAVGWKRATRWRTSPDPDDARKKAAATA
jgi:hypothetical protein